MALFSEYFLIPGNLCSMAYQAFRENGFPTFYGESKTAWQADILEAGLIFAFCILASSFYVILPGIRGKEVSIQHLYYTPC